MKPEEVPGFVNKAEDLSEAAFQSLQHDPLNFHILSELAARPDMSVEEIESLKNPDLLSDQTRE